MGFSDYISTIFFHFVLTTVNLFYLDYVILGQAWDAQWVSMYSQLRLVIFYGHRDQFFAKTGFLTGQYKIMSDDLYFVNLWYVPLREFSSENSQGVIFYKKDYLLLDHCFVRKNMKSTSKFSSYAMSSKGISFKFIGEKSFNKVPKNAKIFFKANLKKNLQYSIPLKKKISYDPIYFKHSWNTHWSSVEPMDLYWL